MLELIHAELRKFFEKLVVRTTTFRYAQLSTWMGDFDAELTWKDDWPYVTGYACYKILL